MPGSTSKAIHRKAGGPPCRDWNTQRWAWLDAVHAEKGISDRARLLADTLCRRLANNETGLCIHTLDDVAAELYKSKRTTQRALQELEQRGWVHADRRCGRNGAVVFHFKKVAQASQNVRRKKVTNSTSCREIKVTSTTPNHVRPVAPIIEPNKNQIGGGNGQALMWHSPYERVHVAADDELAVSQWNDWLIAQGLETLDKLALATERDGKRFYILPSRYPPSDRYDDLVENALHYFEQAKNRRSQSD